MLGTSKKVHFCPTKGPATLDPIVFLGIVDRTDDYKLDLLLN